MPKIKLYSYFILSSSVTTANTNLRYQKRLHVIPLWHDGTTNEAVVDFPTFVRIPGSG